MLEARVRIVPRGLVALSLACAMAVPVSAMSTAAPVSQPTQRVLLGTIGEVDDVAAAVTAVGGNVVATYEIAQALLADLPAQAAVPEGSFVVPNVTMEFNAAPSAASPSDDKNTFRETIGAPGAQGGTGITVAVIDTGVDASADIDVTEHVNVSGDETGDGLGHGTFMAGLVAGDDTTYGGVAPGAEVLDVQVADQDGSTDLARVLAGLQAVADRRADQPSLQVAMLALSTDSPLPPWLDPLTRGLDRLWARGVTVVVASGNDGKDAVSSPATDPVLLVAGSQDEADTAARGDDTVPDFSSYDKVYGEVRPDIVAPGVSLISTAAPGSQAYRENPGSHVGDGFLKGTGTSMSAAVTAGALAALLAQRPDLTPDQAKALLINTAYRTPGLRAKDGAGSGGLDLAAALTAPVPAVQGNPKADSPRFGPAEADAAVWAQFAKSWQEGDLRAVAKAWVQLSEQSRRWAANAWSIAALVQALTTDDGTFESRRWAGHRWATDAWKSRRWATDEWVSRRWADEQWLEQMWDSRRWADADWSSRRWAADDWLSFAWMLRTAETDPTILQMWRDNTWDSRRWASRRWASRRWADADWSSRRWADVSWVSRRWAAEAWDSRRWADYSWDSRRWATGDWSSRRWADFSFDSRRWATTEWDSRRWATQGW